MPDVLPGRAASALSAFSADRAQSRQSSARKTASIGILAGRAEKIGVLGEKERLARGAFQDDIYVGTVKMTS
jgi:hypothetical protein